MYTLIALFLTVGAISLIQRLIDRGFRERIIANRFLQEAIVESLCTAEMAGIGIRDIDYARRRQTKRMARRNVATAAIYLGLALILHGAIGMGTMTTAAILTGLATIQSFGFMSAFGEQVMRSKGYLKHAAPMPSSEYLPRLLGLLITAMLSFISLWLIISSTENFADDGLFSALGFGKVVVGVLLAGYVASPARLIERRLLSQRRTDRFGTAATSDEILFLRAFDDDQQRIRWAVGEQSPLASFTGGERVRLEELISGFIRDVGNLVAIGRPGERLPLLGAARTYWSDDQWQEAVHRTAVAARSIVMIAGTTAGLKWEISSLRSWGLLSKCLFVVPPGSPDDTTRRIARFCDELDIEPDGLDEFPSLAMVGFSFSRRGRLILYVSNGREWLAYGAMITAFHGYLDGSVKPVEHGRIAERWGYSIVIEEQ